MGYQLRETDNRVVIEPPLRTLRSAVNAMTSIDPSELADAELPGFVLGPRRQMDRLAAVFADAVTTGHRRGVGTVDGHQSTAAWLRWQAATPSPAQSGAVVDLRGRMDGGLIGPVDPSQIQALLCECSISRVVTGPDSEPTAANSRHGSTMTPAPTTLLRSPAEVEQLIAALATRVTQSRVLPRCSPRSPPRGVDCSGSESMSARGRRHPPSKLAPTR